MTITAATDDDWVQAKVKRRSFRRGLAGLKIDSQ
jgi:hypothetical protein